MNRNIEAVQDENSNYNSFLFQTISKGIRDLLTIEDPFWNRSISLPPREDLGMHSPFFLSRIVQIDYSEKRLSNGTESNRAGSITYKTIYRNTFYESKNLC